MALSKIQAESMNLADTYAFSGTVSGIPQGLTLINSTSSTTTVTSFNIDNVFSSTYKFYRIYMRVEYTQNTGFYMRLLDSSGTVRLVNYFYNDLSMFNNGTSALYQGTNVSSWFNGRPSGGNVAGGGNRGHHYVIDMYDPYGTSVTHTFQKLMGWNDAAGFYYSGTFIGHNTNQESHRGFTVVGNSGPNIMQHDVKVYGVTNV